MSIDSFYIRELKSDSHKAFNHLYEAYSDSLYGFVLLHTRSADIACEVVQDTFIRIWDIRYTISTEGSFKSLLFTVAKNKIIDSFRRQINKAEFVDFIEYCENENLTCNNSETELYYEDFYKELLTAKNMLSPRQRQIFELSREKGFNNAEIAESLNINEQTVKNQLTTALKIVRTQLAKYHLLFALFV